MSLMGGEARSPVCLTHPKTRSGNREPSDGRSHKYYAFELDMITGVKITLPFNYFLCEPRINVVLITALSQLHPPNPKTVAT